MKTLELGSEIPKNATAVIYEADHVKVYEHGDGITQLKLHKKATMNLAHSRTDRRKRIFIKSEAISVTTENGNEYQGNKDARINLMCAITALDPGEFIEWIMKHNDVATVTREELKEALKLSMAAYEVLLK